MSQLPRAARAYWTAIVGGGAIVLVGAALTASMYAQHLTIYGVASVGVMAGLCLMAEALSISLETYEQDSASQSVGSAAAIAAVVILPWYFALLVTTMAVGITRWRQPPIKTVFNSAGMSLSVAASAAAFHTAGGVAALTGTSFGSVPHAVLTLVALSAVYYSVMTGLVMALLSLIVGQRPWRVYHAIHLKIVLQEWTAIGLGLIFAALWLRDPVFTPLVVLPVLMAYFSIETFVRIQQETRESVLAMSESIDHRDPLTYNHSSRVAALSVELARELGLSHEQVATIELSALVHDIGKIGIPNEILMKPGPLTPEERLEIERHPVIGWEMLRHYKQFRRGLGIVRWHHEFWNGQGYPDKIAGPNIPLEARIVSIADAYEAMTAKRYYRAAVNSAIALQRLEESAGSQFDPSLVPAFRSVCERIGELREAAPESVPAIEVECAPAPAEPPVPPPKPARLRPAGGASLRRISATAARCRPRGRMTSVEADA